MNALVHERRRVGALTPTLPRDFLCMDDVSSLPCVHGITEPRTLSRLYDLKEIRRAALERLREGDRDAYRWAMDWIELCQSARGGKAVVYER